MGSLIRNGALRLLVNNSFVTKSDFQIVRSITSKVFRDSDPERSPKPAPYDYINKRYNILKYWSDRTTSRLDDNSKVVIVDGPPAAGKTAFAKQLAEELDMFYFPEANLDMTYINSYGFDLKQLDDQLPEGARSFDIKDFLRTPKHRNTISFQVGQYHVKYSLYIDALAYLLNTGRGVVLDRSPHSDFVFLEAMYSQGYIDKTAYRGYYEIRSNTLPIVLHPHLVIYLDVPVERTLDNIKKRNLNCERNSTVLTAEYLKALEKAFKHKYLDETSKHSEILVYDWTEGGDVEIIVEDIERISFERPGIGSPKFADWVYRLEEDWGATRNLFTDKKDIIMSHFNVPLIHIPALYNTAEETAQIDLVMENAPGRYARGFNRELGDSSYWFKMGRYERETLPLRERQLQ